MSANHFWTSVTDPQPQERLQDQARLRGLAFDRRSLPQASMGIAVDDPDRDGDVDFYVTHFSGDYNTFYEQISPGIWSDVSEKVGHAAATNAMLAFGTQFIDADNDRRPELMIANGHVFNKGDEAPYRMPNQLMERREDGYWVELNPKQVGQVFAVQRLSRSLVTWDYNRDGRLDALVTHLFDPVSLLENQSRSQASSVTLYLKGTRSCTDAVGAMARVSIGNETIHAQLFGGHGFQCSNQRCLHIGMGNADRVDSVTVRWPNGTEESFGSLKAGGEYLLIEGQNVPFAFSR